MMHAMVKPALAMILLAASVAASAAPSCAATYVTRDDWATGFVADVVVTNTGASAVSGWKVSWTYGSPVAQASAAWGATVTVSGNTVNSVDNGSHPSIPAGASVSFGMALSHSGAKPEPGVITVSGVNCVVTAPNSSLYSDPQSAARQWVQANPADGRTADITTRIANQAGARWFGGWSGDIGTAVNSYVTAAAALNRMPILVAYNIPARDCGQYSAGGAGSLADYQNWIRAFATAIGMREAVVVLEPDALPQLDCLDAAGKTARLQLFNYAVAQFNTRAPRTYLYLDIGNSVWLTPTEAAARLVNAGIGKARGFALNVSNYRVDTEATTYGINVSNALVSQLGAGKPFVVDTSRNGNGPHGAEWCDPPQRKIGAVPQVGSGSQPEMSLWIKAPGEADGCAGAAGTFLPDMAYKMIYGY